MRKKITKLFLFTATVIMLFFAFSTMAGAEQEGLYIYKVTNNKATITGIDSSVSGDIVIPSTLDAYPVTAIGYYAFANSAITDVTIPNSVTSIDDKAFSNCDYLTNITIPNSVTSIGNSVFYDCKNLTTVTIGNSVTSIGNEIFYNCDKLTNITIPNSVTTIGNKVFYDCNNLTEVTIGDTVKSIGDEMFYNCYNLKEVTIGKSVTSIGNDTFYNCDNLTNVTIPNGVTTMGCRVFNACDNLTNVTIGNSVASIGEMAFYDCNNLTTVTVGNNVTSISGAMFSNCTNLTDISIGNHVTSIAENAFYNCKKLTSVTLPDSIKSIGDNAFYNCGNLTGITIPDNVTSIGDNAFYNCDSLTNITIPDSVLTIGQKVFYDCEKLTAATIGNNVTSINDWMFYNCVNLTDVSIGNSITSIGISAFNNCDKLTVITIGNNIISIDDSVFSNCNNLTAVIIPSTVTTIGSNIFYNCSKLKYIIYTGTEKQWNKISINENNYNLTCCPRYYNATGLATSSYYTYTIPVAGYNKTAIIEAKTTINGEKTIPSKFGGYTLTTIGNSVFRNCDNLTAITIPDSVTTIEHNAFSDCDSLKSVIIPNSIATMGDGVFDWCDSLKDIYLAFNSNKWVSLGMNEETDINYHYNVTNVPAHYVSETIIKKATCTTIGEKIMTCECGFDKPATIPAGHTAGIAATCSAPQKCTGCGIVLKEKLSHSYKTVTTKATLSANGSVKTTCTICGAVKSNKTISYPKTFTLSTTSYTYNGYIRKPTVTVKDAAGNVLKKDTDYTVTYSTGRKNVGTYNVIVKMKGNYTGTKTLSFKIKPIDISKCTVKLSATSVTYNGKVRTPAVTITNPNGVKLTKDTHYTVSYASGRKNVGTYKITVTMKGNYTGTKTLTFKINPINISTCKVKLSATSLTYNGNVRTPTVTVTNANGVKLTKNTHYTVTYASGRKNVGTYKVTVKMIGNYTGTKTLSFKINPINISTCKVKLSATSLTYNGNVRTPTVTVTNSYGTKLTKDKHYTVTYASERKNVGTYKVTVKMIGNYTGTKTLTFKINPIKISTCTVKLSATSLTYNGNVRTPVVTVTNAYGTKLTKDKHYTVTYASGRKNVGTYKVTVKMIGNYTGTKTLSFKINPPATTVTSLKAGTKSITVNLEKNTTQVTGYQIQYSTDMNFKNAKTKTITSSSTVKTTLSSLSSGKTYYVRVRTYKTVNDVKYYSGWSAYRYVKTK